jgi:thiol-disulfide isomerase/thioredoxin
MNKKLTSVFLLTLALLFSGCNSDTTKAQEVTNTSSKSKKASSKMVSYTLTTTKGETINIEAARGYLQSEQFKDKMILVNFWAPWCKPCLKEMPTFVELQEKYKDDFVIIAVLFKQKKTKEELAKFMQEYKMNFPVTVGEQNAVMARGFGDIQMIPESFLYSKDGLFLEKFVGEISKDKLEGYIKSGSK